MTEPTDDPEYFADYPEETEVLRQIFEDAKTAYRLLGKIKNDAALLRSYAARRVTDGARWAQDELSCGWNGLERLFGDFDYD